MGADEQQVEMDDSVALRRAQLVVQCAREWLNQLRARELAASHNASTAEAPRTDMLPALRLDLTVAEFQAIFQQRYGAIYPSLVNRSDSSLERARLERRAGWSLPKVLLRRGAPPGRGLRRDKDSP